MRQSKFWFFLFLACAHVQTAFGSALETYVRRPDPHFNWKRTERKAIGSVTVTHLEMVSQHWRDQFWSHHLQVLRPNQIRHTDTALLYVTGDGDGSRNLPALLPVAERIGAMVIVLTQVPNQPLYDGRKEDALIAYTFDNYLKDGDETWPLLFPMVKSAVRAMDAVQEFARKEFEQDLKHFVVTGASKRGWTTWLTGAVDPRVKAIAPMVIDMLNMKRQLEWAEKMYGRQSEEISDYTNLNLHQRLDDPPMQKLRSWVDPYSYRERYTLPKLILIGTNDPYWVVDSLRHYWSDLPAPKLIFQTPNAGHDLGGGKEAFETLGAFFQFVAQNKPIPEMAWTIENSSNTATTLSATLNHEAKKARLWTAYSMDRDFRDDQWSSQELTVTSGSSRAEAKIETPQQGYRAFLIELELVAPDGRPFKLSTEARVTPDGKR
jgi:PhoPQ-activated pathogenicity-related protein